MGLLFKARGNSSIGIFLIRFVIGLVFIIAGAKKAINVEGFIVYVKSLDILSDNLAFILGFILPFAEIFFGALFLIGFLTPFTSFILSVFELIFILTYSSLYISNPQYSISPIAYNFLMLACTIGIIFSGAGAISFDVLLDKRKREKRVINVVGDSNQKNIQPPSPVASEINVKDADFIETK